MLIYLKQDAIIFHRLRYKISKIIQNGANQYLLIMKDIQNALKTTQFVQI